MRGLGAAVVAVLMTALSGCDGSGDGALRVSAAASLKAAFTEYADDDFGGREIDQSFAGSDQLAAQIEQGAKPDVFASANTEYPNRLHREGLLEAPVVFARNRLVLAVPTGGQVGSLSAAARPGVSIVIGDPSAPVGAYAREVLERLRAPERRGILANVRSQEPDVTSIVGKLTEGAADAAFVYATDVRAAGGALRAIPLPRSLRPDVSYGIAVVTGSSHPDLARKFVRGLRPGEPGFRLLLEAGFLPPP